MNNRIYKLILIIINKEIFQGNNNNKVLIKLNNNYKIIHKVIIKY